MTRSNQPTYQRILFLDRDGVINVDHGYVSKREDFSFLPGIFDLVRAAREQAYGVVVVTNQSGIGRGYYTEDEFWLLTKWMTDQFQARDAQIDHVFFCPYHPKAKIEKFRQVHPWRKPSPGMLLAAKEKFQPNMAESIFIGDKETDIAAGHAAGVGTLLLLGTDDKSDPKPTAVIGSLSEAVKWL
ncbi:MAG: HAD family hydrolase [Rhodobiaceae bacterium]|nr:HAD family hydrolase [Rhodobiaceae bacterium]